MQTTAGFSKLMTPKKLRVEFQQLCDMFETSPSKDTFIKSAGFNTSEDDSDTVVTVRRKALEWSQMLTDGMSLVYNNGVAVWYGWTHARRKLPLVMTGEMVIRS